ncbi:MAG: hypothetical protein QNK31_11375 [Porticoccus sp.]|nr:hypothetical protein [Porticoccus sp.]
MRANPRLSSWFLILGLSASSSLLLKNIILGGAYSLAFLPLAVFVILARRWGREVNIPVFIAVCAIYSFYFIRPVFLGFYPDLFGYQHVDIPATATYALTMLYVGGFSVAFLVGLYSALVFGRRPNKSRFVLSHSGVIVRLRYLFLFSLLVLVCLWAGLVLIFGVGVKKEFSNLEILKFILPISLIIPSALGYLSIGEYRTISLVEKFLIIIVVGAMFFLILIGGSKLGSFLLLLYGLIVILLIRGDFRIGPLHAAILIIGAGVLVFVSVIAANVIKYHGLDGFFNPSEWLYEFSEYAVFTVDRITFRLTGYDGLLVTLIEQPEVMKSIIRWDSITINTVQKLIPGFSGSEMSLGKAVAVYYGGKAPDIQYSGALGFFGMLYLMHGLIGGVLMASVLGAFYGGCFRAVMNMSVGSTEKVIAISVLCYQMAHWLSSGNFDSMFQEFVITALHLFFYYVCLRLMLGIVSQKNHIRSF